MNHFFGFFLLVDISVTDLQGIIEQPLVQHTLTVTVVITTTVNQGLLFDRSHGSKMQQYVDEILSVNLQLLVCIRKPLGVKVA